jgi:integrase
MLLMARRKKGRKRYRANGEGWNNERADGRYDVGLTIHTPDGPKRIRTTKRTRAEGDAWLAEQKRSRNLGTVNFDAGFLTFGEYLERWLEDGVKGVLKEGSYLTHRNIVRRHLKPSLGRVKLAKLTAAHFQALYRQKLEEGLKARTVLGIHGTARKALGQAIRWDLIPHGKNAAANARPPRPEDAEAVPLSREEASRLLKATEGHRLRALYVLALSTGARHGELLALRWQDVSLREDGAEVAIRHTFSRAIPKKEGGTSYSVGTPKTGKARLVSVGRKTAQALRAHKSLQAEERLALGPRYQDSPYVFTDAKGGILNQRTSIRAFNALCEEVGLPEGTRFHALRHTAATVAFQEGVPGKVVSEMLGHSSIKQTLDTYSHVMPGMQEDAAIKLDGALF